MSPTDMQGNYVAALAKISSIQVPQPARRRPIFQRDTATTQKQAIADAAVALSALWRQNR